MATDFFILNNSGIALSLAVETGAGKFSGLLEVPGDGVAGFEIPNQYMAHVFTDADDGTYKYVAGSADISSQPSGTSIKWKIETYETGGLVIDGVGITWG